MAHTIPNAAVRRPLPSSESDENDVVIPKRPEPTPEQARLGIMPAAIGNGTVRDIMNAARTRPDLDDAEFEAFARVIAENRAMRRQLAEERGE